MEKNNNNVVIISLVIVIIVLIGIIGFMIINQNDDRLTNKNDNGINDSEIKTEDEKNESEIKVGSLGSNSVKIEGNIDTYEKKNYSWVEVQIESDGSLTGKMLLKNPGTTLKFSGINEKAVRLLKTYTDDAPDFEMAVLTENGNVYVANIVMSSITDSIEFLKVESKEKIFGIDTLYFTGYSAGVTKVIAYDQNNVSYVVLPTYDENNQIIGYNANTKLDEYKANLR